MGLSRSSSGLIFRDDFTTDTSADYTASDSRTLSVSSERLAASNYCVVMHDNQHQGRCITVKSYRAAGVGAGYIATVTSTGATYLSWAGYGVYFRNSTSLWSLMHDMGNWVTSDVDIPGATGWVHTRLFVSTGNQEAWCGCSWPLQAHIHTTETTHHHDTGTLYSAVLPMSSSNTTEYYDVRTNPYITCTGLPSGYQLQANSSSSYKATESGGTATLEVAVLEWPLTSVEVLNASNGQVAQVTNATYNNMGGGDAFNYTYSDVERKTIQLRLR